MKNGKCTPHSDAQAPKHPEAPPNSISFRRRYADFFQFAPVGYFAISRAGVILEANSSGALLLGTDRNGLLNQPFSQFISPESKRIFQLHRLGLFDTRTKQICDLKLLDHHENPIWVQLEPAKATRAIQNSFSR